MIYFFSAYFLIVKNKSKIFFFLIGFIIVTLALGFLIDKQPELLDFIDVWNTGFTFTILVLIITGFNKYDNLRYVIPYRNPRNFKKLINILVLVGLLIFALNLYITYKSFGVLVSGIVNITSFKNQGEAGDFLVQWVGSSLLFLSRFLSPLGYFALGLHFFFLIKREMLKSFVFFVISLNIPLLGLHTLSRSAVTQFLLLYLAYFIYSYSALGKKIRKGMFVYGILIFTAALFFLNMITESRFSKYYNVPIESKIQDYVTYSVIDYAAQWNQNGVEVLRIYDIDKIMYGKATFPIVGFVKKKLGYEVETLPDTRLKYLGDKYDGTFNGLVATLIFDFGYLFTLIFAILFRKIVITNAPRKGYVSLRNFIGFGVLIPLPLMFFTNSVYSYVSMNMAIIYLLLLNLVLRFTKNN